MQGRDRGEAWRSSSQAWDVIGTLLAGILVWGGVGYALDRWLGFERFLFLPIGMLLGAGVAIYGIAKRYGSHDA
jgi:F0F1-type ATP synthase assembly protein I